MEHMHFQQTHLPFWPRNSAIGGRKNDIFAQILGNHVAGNVLRRTIQHTCLQNADVDATSSMWLSAKDCPGDLLAPVIAHAIRQSVVSMLAKRRGIASNSSVSFTWDTLASLTLESASWTTWPQDMHCMNASPGIWQSRATARMNTRFSLAWQANGMLKSFVSYFEWAEGSLVVPLLYFGRSKGTGQWASSIHVNTP